MTQTRALTARASLALGAQLDYILLDMSGSMISKWDEMLRATQQYVEIIQGSTLNSHVMLCTFDDSVPQLVRDEPIRDFMPLTGQYGPRASWGGTALYDAINSVARQLRDLDPERCSVLIVTDGDDQDSQYTKAHEAGAIIEWMKAKGWQVTFFGCDFNNDKLMRKLGVDPATGVAVAAARLTDAAKTIASKRVRYGHSGDDITFSDDEKQQFGGYLAGPSGG